ncbi:NAD(P)-binding protein [Clostridium sp. MCC353]|uniref:oxidoreductase n=1 Tax=Clostridium sp. MCC353 TaxID=2592646 RepID=UPI001C037DD9|nr:FAD-dependent oxidoreductase [Clostridium sp. MCC353]MBT9776826.1 NAD(P)-binding protein [Clostridium sp. MCC353]
MDNALSSISIGKVHLKNRIVYPSICTHFCNSDGSLTDEMREYVHNLAAGGSGLIIIPGNPHPADSAARPGISSDEHIKDWAELSGLAHSYGAKLFCQLHPVAVTDENGLPVDDPRDFSLEMIRSLTASYGDAAVRCKKAGVDGCEIQSCHERYIADFLSERSNHRTDEYGGNVRNRTRLSLEILENIKDKAGKDFPVVFKLSSSEAVFGGRELPETLEIAKLLSDAGADGFTVSIGMCDSEEIKCAPMDMPDCLNAASSRAFKEITDVPVILVDRVVTMEEANEMISTGKADLVGMGRAQLADPALVNKYLGLNPDPAVVCIGCNQGCRTGLAGARKRIRCMQNPFIGNAAAWKLNEAGPKLRAKKIAVIGTGPAGLEAACLLVKQGLKPEIYEKAGIPGGLINLAAMPPHKENMVRLIECRIKYLEQHGVRIHYDTEYTLERAELEQPDFIFAATGGKPLVIPVDGIQDEHVITGDEVLSGRIPDGKHIAVLGGGLIGCETAEYLSSYHNKVVEIFEMREDIALDLVESRRKFMLTRMKNLGIIAHTGAKVQIIDLPRIVIEKKDGAHEYNGFDAVVLAMGRQPERTLIEQLLNQYKRGNVYVIGDAQKPSFAMDAVTGAAESVYRFMKENNV